MKKIDKSWWWSEHFENIELESLFQRYASKVQTRSSFLIFALGNAVLALLHFRLSMETLALGLTAVTLVALWVLQRLYGREWILTTAWILFSILFCILPLPAPIPHRTGKIAICNDYMSLVMCYKTILSPKSTKGLTSWPWCYRCADGGGRGFLGRGIRNLHCLRLP